MCVCLHVVFVVFTLCRFHNLPLRNKTNTLKTRNECHQITIIIMMTIMIIIIIIIISDIIIITFIVVVL